MRLFSSLTSLLLLFLIIGCDNKATDGDAAIEPFLNNIASIVRLKEAFEKRDEEKPVFCGKTRIRIGPVSGSKNISKDDEYDQYDDVNDYEHLDKIFGGSYVTYGEIPWQANVLLYTEPFCGGAIIGEFWIITAAHCIDGHAVKFMKIAVGDHRFYYPDPYEVTFEVELYSVHTGYINIKRKYSDDIALVKIKAKSGGRGIQFNDYVQPICLLISPEIPWVGMEVLVSGWGKTRGDIYGYHIPIILKKAKMTIIPDTTCRRMYGVPQSPTLLCITSDDSEICSGDSGGPVAYLKSVLPLLVGVIVYASGCGNTITPMGASSIHAHLVWIDETIRRFSNGTEGVMPLRYIPRG